MQNEYSSLISELLEGNDKAWSTWTTLLETNSQDPALQQQLTETRKQLEGLARSKENVHAINLLARMYEHALGGDQDFNQAMECYKIILGSGDWIALMNMHDHARDLSWARDIPFVKEKEREVQSIMAHGRSVLQLAIDEANDQGAMVSLALQYETGSKFVEPDYTAAIKLYEQAIRLGNLIALLFLADMHMSGRGGDVNYPKARELLNELRENYPSESKPEYEQKIAVIDYLSSIKFDEELRLAKANAQEAKDNTDEHKRAVNYYKSLALYSTALDSISEPSLSAFRENCARAKNSSIRTNNDNGIDKHVPFQDERDVDEYIPFQQNEYSSLISELLKGNNPAWRTWTTLLKTTFQDPALQQQLIETRKQLEDLAKSKENVHAINLLAHMYEYALGGEQDFNQAMECYKIILKLDDWIALSRMKAHARDLSWAQDVPIPLVKAGEVQSIMDHGRKVLQLAIDETNDTSAMVSLASVYKIGKGLEEPDYAAAIKLYERAIHLGSYIALLYRADMHMNGVGGDVNYPKARELLNELWERSTPEFKSKYEQKITVIDYLSSIKFDEEMRLAKANAQEVKDNTGHESAVKYYEGLVIYSAALDSTSELSLREFLEACAKEKNWVITRSNDKDIDKHNPFQDELDKLHKKLEAAGDKDPITEDKAPPSPTDSDADEHTPLGDVRPNAEDKDAPPTTDMDADEHTPLADIGPHGEDKASSPPTDTGADEHTPLADIGPHGEDKTSAPPTDMGADEHTPLGDIGPHAEDKASPPTTDMDADEPNPFQHDELDKNHKKPETAGDKRPLPEDKAPDPTIKAFIYHYNIIVAKTAEMTDKAKTDKTYIIAAQKATELCLNLTTAKKAFDSADKPDIQSLKLACISAINDAKPVLQDFRGWTRILMKFMNAIIKGLNATGLTHFGHFKPDALKKVEQFENDIAPRKNPIR